jgi:hypothetical protein
MKLAKYSLTAILLFCASLLLSAAIAPASCRADEDYAEETVTAYTVAGEIISVDTVAGVIVVKWTQTYPTIANDEITLKVPDDASIVKGSDTIGPMDINQFDRATIKYRKPQGQSAGLPVVISMVIIPSD